MRLQCGARAALFLADLLSQAAICPISNYLVLSLLCEAVTAFCAKICVLLGMFRYSLLSLVLSFTCKFFVAFGSLSLDFPLLFMCGMGREAIYACSKTGIAARRLSRSGARSSAGGTSQLGTVSVCWGPVAQNTKNIFHRMLAPLSRWRASVESAVPVASPGS